MKPICNPFLPGNVCIADGEPHVFGDRVYLFGSHDTPGGHSFCLEDYEFYSAPLTDLSDWTSKGINYSARQDPLYGKDAQYLYAPDVVQGNDGRFYLYYCLAGWKGKGGYSHPISVAVCDTPDGHYRYYGVVQAPDGSPYRDWVCFDPAVLNDDGVIRLYFGTGPFRGMAVNRNNAFLLSRIYARVFGRPAEAFLESPGPLGANTAVLRDDMLTMVEPPRRIADTPDFKGHAFFEGCSIRKDGATYYFVYSSQKNHELCYATSQFPDRGFRFRGTLVSNGDVGLQGRKERDRRNATGTTHGGMECINGQWYVFYHRLTHGSDYSRQMCAEKLTLGGGRHHPPGGDDFLRPKPGRPAGPGNLPGADLLQPDQWQNAPRGQPAPQTYPHGDPCGRDLFRGQRHQRHGDCVSIFFRLGQHPAGADGPGPRYHPGQPGRYAGGQLWGAGRRLVCAKAETDGATVPLPAAAEGVGGTCGPAVPWVSPGAAALNG